MLGPNLLDSIAHRQRDDGAAMLARRRHYLRDHFLRQKRPNRIVYDNDIRFIRHMFERMPNGVLPFAPTRNHFGDFRESVPHRQIVQTVVEIGLRNREDDLIDARRGLQHTQGMHNERLTA